MQDQIAIATGDVGGIGAATARLLVIGMTKTVTLDLVQFLIRFNSVHFGVIDTPVIRRTATAEKVAE